MTPEEFVDSMLPPEYSNKWQRDLLIKFLKLPESDRRIMISPRRGDGLSRTRTMLCLYNMFFEESKKGD